MKNTTWILGIDNGVSGSFTLMNPRGQVIMFSHVPTYKEVKWTKPKVKKLKSGEKKLTYDYITLVDMDALQRMLASKVSTIQNIQAFLERPAISYAASWSMATSISAAMAWEAVIHVLRKLKIPVKCLDSRAWQTALIPEALGKNNKEYKKTLKAGERNKLLKEASDMHAKMIYPAYNGKELGDGDSINIAYYGLQLVTGALDEE